MAPLQDAPWLAYPLQVAVSLLSAVVAGPGRWRKTAGFSLALLSLPIPWLVPASMGVFRFLLVLTSLLAVLRAIDRVRDRQPVSLGMRVWAVTAPFDTRKVTRAPARLELGRLGAALGYGALAALGWWVALPLANQHDGAAHFALRWLGGALFAYTLIDATIALLIAGHRAVGFVLPPLHREPVLAQSLQEFWGERWNLTMRDWFHANCFMPLARKRRATLGVVASFGASVLIHVWIALAIAGAGAAASTGAFFALQGLLTLVERRIGAGHLPPALGHAWTVVCVLGTSPLFVEPILQGFER